VIGIFEQALFQEFARFCVVLAGNRFLSLFIQLTGSLNPVILDILAQALIGLTESKGPDDLVPCPFFLCQLIGSGTARRDCILCPIQDNQVFFRPYSRTHGITRPKMGLALDRNSAKAQFSQILAPGIGSELTLREI
jgi:hypothetical protein